MTIRVVVSCAMVLGVLNAASVHAAEITKVDLNAILGAIDVNLPSLMGDCASPIDRGILPYPYENLTGNGLFFHWEDKNYYTPYKEFYDKTLNYSQQVLKMMNNEAFVNNNLSLYGLENKLNQSLKVTCLTHSGKIKDLTFSYDKNTRKTSAQYTQQLDNGKFDVYTSPSVDENGRVQQVFQFRTNDNTIHDGLSVEDTLKVMKDNNPYANGLPTIVESPA